MTTRNDNVYCNLCDTHMGGVHDGEFTPFPHIHNGGYLRMRVTDLQSPPVVYECDYCPKCNGQVISLLTLIKIREGRL